MDRVHMIWLCVSALIIFFVGVIVSSNQGAVDCAIIAGAIQQRCVSNVYGLKHTDMGCVESNIKYFDATKHCGTRHMLLIRAFRFDDVIGGNVSSAVDGTESSG